MKTLVFLFSCIVISNAYAGENRETSEFFFQPESGQSTLRPGFYLGYDHIEQTRNTNSSKITRNVVTYFLDLEFQHSFSNYLTVGATVSYGIRVNDFITWQSPITYSENGFKDFDFSAKGRAPIRKDIDLIYGGNFLWSPTDLIIIDKYDRNYFSGGNSLSGYFGFLYKTGDLKLSTYYSRDLWAEDKSVDDQENNIQYSLEVEESQTLGFVADLRVNELFTIAGQLEFVNDSEIVGYNEVDYWQFEALFNFSPAKEIDLFLAHSFGRITTDEVPGFKINDSRLSIIKLNARFRF